MYKINEKQFKEMPPELQALYEKLPNPSSDEVVELFPNTKKGGASGYNFEKGNQDNPARNVTNIKSGIHFGDSGSASRFFYCAKASKSERNRGCEELEEKQKAGAEFRPNHQEKALLGESGNPFGRWNKITNNHPTVKPIALMEYLVKLVTKKGGIVLDPFAGSGSTLLACKNLNRQYIGIEREPEYIKIIEARLK